MTALFDSKFLESFKEIVITAHLNGQDTSFKKIANELYRAYQDTIKFKSVEGRQLSNIRPVLSIIASKSSFQNARNLAEAVYGNVSLKNTQHFEDYKKTIELLFAYVKENNKTIRKGLLKQLPTHDTSKHEKVIQVSEFIEKLDNDWLNVDMQTSLTYYEYLLESLLKRESKHNIISYHEFKMENLHRYKTKYIFDIVLRKIVETQVEELCRSLIEISNVNVSVGVTSKLNKALFYMSIFDHFYAYFPSLGLWVWDLTVLLQKSIVTILEKATIQKQMSILVQLHVHRTSLAINRWIDNHFNGHEEIYIQLLTIFHSIFKYASEHPSNTASKITYHYDDRLKQLDEYMTEWDEEKEYVNEMLKRFEEEQAGRKVGGRRGTRGRYKRIHQL